MKIISRRPMGGDYMIIGVDMRDTQVDLGMHTRREALEFAVDLIASAHEIMEFVAEDKQ